MYPSNYLLKGSSKEDIEIPENDLDAAYTTKSLYRGLVKYYA
jgi:hypothetical protein